jgi:hypothetical protein
MVLLLNVGVSDMVRNQEALFLLWVRGDCTLFFAALGNVGEVVFRLETGVGGEPDQADAIPNKLSERELLVHEHSTVSHETNIAHSAENFESQRPHLTNHEKSGRETNSGMKTAMRCAHIKINYDREKSWRKKKKI